MMHILKSPRIFFLFLCTLFFLSCGTSNQPEIGTDEFILADNLEISLIASEPLLDSPVAMAFDPSGRIWAVELRSYMRDIDGSDEQAPDGRIVILEDENGDGRMDKQTVFLDSLVTPRALAFAYGGLLYTNDTSLWWVALNDKSPGEKVLVDSLYVIGGNIEHQPNGLLYNLDNWIYSAKSNARYRRVAGKWLKEATAFRGQWGITHDDEGRLFYNDNSNPLQGDYLMPNQLIANPFLAARFGTNRQIATDRRVFPWQATPVNRGYMKGVLDEEHKLRHVTSSCGPVIYRGTKLPAAFYGDAFVCAPEVNLIKQYTVRENGARVQAVLTYENSEFLISKDQTFRPVNLYNATDGGLYVLDMRKGVIQHRAYMTDYLRKKLLEMGLDKVSGKGRIYRVTSRNKITPERMNLAKMDGPALVKALYNESGTIRSGAQKELVFRDLKTMQRDLETAARAVSTPFAQIHALWTLEGLDLLTPSLLKSVALNAEHPALLVQLLRLTALFPTSQQDFMPLFKKWRALHSPKVDLQLAHTIGSLKTRSAEKIWLELARTYKNDPLFCDALISGIAGRESQLLKKWRPTLPADSLSSFIKKTIAFKTKNEVQAPQLLTRTFKDRRTLGFTLYSTTCAPCHGLDGKGAPNLAPPILNSEYLSGAPAKMILPVLHGLKGPVHVNGTRYDMNLVMPGIKDNPELSDKDLAAILTFVRNSFSYEPRGVQEKEVTALRKATTDRKDLYTEDELKELYEFRTVPPAKK